MSPARNRVTPTGEIVAIPLRGAWTGNRGILHRGREIVRFHGSDLWITCALQFKGRHQEQWRSGHYTFLFFHDEAVSFAAGFTNSPGTTCRTARSCSSTESQPSWSVADRFRLLLRLR